MPRCLIKFGKELADAELEPQHCYFREIPLQRNWWSLKTFVIIFLSYSKIACNVTVIKVEIRNHWAV